MAEHPLATYTGTATPPTPCNQPTPPRPPNALHPNPLDEGAKGPRYPGVQGYFYNHGGLNNQKMALVGLMLTGIARGEPINLPYIYNRDQRTEEEQLARFDDIFELEPILDFATENDLTILTTCPSGERGGWEAFGAFGGALINPQSRDTALDAVSSLKPLIAATPAFLRLKDFVFGDLGLEVAIQLRIENDWREHSEILRQNHGREGLIGFIEILTKVRNTFPDLRLAYATADEASMPATKTEIRTIVRDRFGIDLLWKSDLLPEHDINGLTPLDLSLIDFEIARHSPRFVGITTSTFANMLAVEAWARTRRPVTGHYIYDAPGDQVVERKDSGTTSAPQVAVQPVA